MNSTPAGRTFIHLRGGGTADFPHAYAEAFKPKNNLEVAKGTIDRCNISSFTELFDFSTSTKIHGCAPRQTSGNLPTSGTGATFTPHADAIGYTPGSTYACDVPLLNETRCLQFGSGSLHKSDILVSNTTLCLSFDSGSAYGSTIPFSNKIPPSNLETAYEPDILDPKETARLPFEPEPPRARSILFLTKSPYHRGTTHEPEIPGLSAKIPFDRRGSACESNISFSNKTLRLSCGPRPVYESSTCGSSEILGECTSACGSDFTFSAQISFRTASANGPDVPYSPETSCDTGSAYESDLPSSTEIPSHTISANGSVDFSNNTQILLDNGCAYESAIPFSGDNVCISSDPRTTYEPDIPFSISETVSLPSNLGSSYESDISLPDEIPFDPESAYASDISFSNEISYDNGHSTSPLRDQSTSKRPSYSFSMRHHHDWSRIIAKTNGSDSASCLVQTTNQPTCGQFARFASSINGSLARPFQFYVDDAETGFKNLYSREVANHTADNVPIPVCKPESTHSTCCVHTTLPETSTLACDAVTQNRTDQDVSDVCGIHAISESHGDDVEDMPIGASLTVDQYIPVFGVVFETSRIALVHAYDLLRLFCWIVIVSGLPRWYCDPENLEKRPRYRKRSEHDALDAKLKLSCASTRLRRCVALAMIRKRFRAWRRDTTKEKYDRIGHVVGVAFLLIIMFQPVAEGSAAFPVTTSSTNMTQHHNETALVSATNVHTDMNQLAALNVDPALKGFIGALAVELRELKRENVGIRKENAEMKGTIVELRNENLEIKNVNANENAEIKNVNAEIIKENAQIKADNAEIMSEVAEIKIKNADMQQENAEMKGEVNELKMNAFDMQKENAQMKMENAEIKSKNAETNTAVMIVVDEMSSRLSQCEAKTDSFVNRMKHRRVQDSGDNVIGDAQPVQIFKRAVTFSHLSGHVDESNGMHRLLAEGGGAVIGCSADEISEQLAVINDKCCDEPEEVCTGGKVQTCNAGCAALIMPLWTSCRAQLGRAAKILHDAAALCSPAAAHRFLAMCPPNAPNEDCIPTCNEDTHGYLLLLSIDGTDTILTCELSDSLYDWLGTSALGGFVGENVGAFLPAVISGAAGAYILKLMKPTNIVTDLTIQPSQKVVVSGDQTLQHPPSWGSGKFTVSESASLSLSYLQVDAAIETRPGALNLQLDSCLLAFEGALSLWPLEATFKNQVFNSGLIIPTGASVNISASSLTFAAAITLPCTVQSGAALSLAHTTLSTQRPGGGNVQMMTIAEGGSFSVSSSQLIHGDSTNPIPCNGANMVCTDPHTGAVVVPGHASINTAAPLVCTDDVTPTCLTSYVDVPSCLEGIAQGLQSCFVYLEQDTSVLGMIVVDVGEEFEIHGTPAQRMQANWTVRGSLDLHGLRVVSGSHGGSQISVEAGGQLSFDQVQMEGGSVTSAGVVSLTESALVSSKMSGSSTSELSLSGGTVTSTTLNVTSGRMTVDTGCVLTNSPISLGGVGSVVTVSGAELQSDGSSVPLTIEADGVVTVTRTVFRITAGNTTAVAVEEGGSMTVSGSQLVGARGNTVPFPCDGTLPHCVAEHDGSAVVEVPSMISIVAPLVCDVETGECQSDLCLLGLVDCGVGGTCVSPYGTSCTCNKGYSGDRCETHTCCACAANNLHATQLQPT